MFRNYLLFTQHVIQRPDGRQSWDVTINTSITLMTQPHQLVECCFTSTETVGLLGTGAQDVHLDFHTAPALRVVLSFNVALRPQRPYGLLGTESPGRPPRLPHSSCPPCCPLVQCCVTSTETVRTIRDGGPGRPPRLAHTSWALNWPSTSFATSPSMPFAIYRPCQSAVF